MSETDPAPRPRMVLGTPGWWVGLPREAPVSIYSRWHWRWTATRDEGLELVRQWWRTRQIPVRDLDPRL